MTLQTRVYKGWLSNNVLCYFMFLISTFQAFKSKGDSLLRTEMLKAIQKGCQKNTFQKINMNFVSSPDRVRLNLKGNKGVIPICANPSRAV